MLNLYGPINNLGYGIFFHNLARELVKTVKCCTTPIGPIQAEIDEGMKASIEAVSSINFGDPSICVYHEFAMHMFTGSPMIGFPIFEGNILVPTAVNMLKQLDHVLVPSEWAATIVREQAHPKGEVGVVGGAVDPSIFNKAVIPHRQFYDPDRFTIVNVGKLELRKGHEDILAAIEQTLSKRNIRILAAWHNPFIKGFDQHIHNYLSGRKWSKERVANRAIYSYGKAIIELVPPQKTSADMAALLKCGNMALFPTRAEGWGLPIMEAMACGVPTAATFCTAMMDYLNADNSYMLTDLSPEPANDNRWFHGDKGTWNQPSLESIVEAIKAGIDGKIPVAPDGFGEFWSWGNSASVLKEFLYQQHITMES